MLAVAWAVIIPALHASEHGSTRGLPVRNGALTPKKCVVRIMLTAEQKKLVEDNQALIFFALKKFHYPADDFYDLAAIGLCKAAARYDPEKGATFASYAVQSIRNELGHWKRTDGHYLRPKISLDDPITEDGHVTLADAIPGEFCIEDTDDTILAQECLKKAKVKEKHRAVFNEWASGRTLRQIADSHGCTVAWAQHVTAKVRTACKDVALNGTGARVV